MAGAIAIPGADVTPGTAAVGSAGAEIVAAPARPLARSPAATRSGRGASWRAHRWPVLAALLVLAGGAAWGVRWWLGPSVGTEAVFRSDFVQTVVASGHVEAPHRLEIGAQITGTVLRVPVSEGQAVKAGDVLVELEAAELTASGLQAELAVTQAAARLRQVREVQGPVAAQTLRRAEAGLANARAALARSEDLSSRGFIGQAALDDTRKAAVLADAEVRAAQRQLDTTGPAGSDSVLALANLAGARAGAGAARARAGYATIRAPVAGTLIARDVEAGDVVQPGRMLMTLSPRGRTQMVVAIDERHLAVLSIGQSARVSADAYPNERLEATIAYINPGVDAGTGAVEVKLDVAAPPAALRQDMTVSVDIEVARRARALIVPLVAVHDPDASPWVLRIEGRYAVRRAVRLGLRSGGLAEVLDGLAEGDAVLAASAGIEPGARVRARPPVAATGRPPA